MKPPYKVTWTNEALINLICDTLRITLRNSAVKNPSQLSLSNKKKHPNQVNKSILRYSAHHSAKLCGKISPTAIPIHCRRSILINSINPFCGTLRITLRNSVVI